MINPKSCVTYRFETFATTTNKLIINVLQIDPQWPYFGVYIFLINELIKNIYSLSYNPSIISN
jgi:hypothetical protein